MTWPRWWFRAYRLCGWSVWRSAWAAWRSRRCDPRAVPGMMGEILAEEGARWVCVRAEPPQEVLISLTWAEFGQSAEVNPQPAGEVGRSDG